MYANGGANGRRPQQQIGLAQFKDELRRLKQEAVDDLSRKMDDLIEKADFSAGNNVLLKYYGSDGGSKEPRQQSSRRRKGELPEKEFVMQNSVLTDLFTSKHIQTIENIVIAALIIWALVTAVSDYFEKGSIAAVLPSLDLVESAFANYQIALIHWVKMMLTAFIIYPIAHFWANNRPRCSDVTSYDRAFLAGYFGYQVFFFSLPYRILLSEPVLGSAAAIAVSLEQIRLMMKMHSFVREVSKRVFRPPPVDQHKKDDGDSQQDSVSSSEASSSQRTSPLPPGSSSFPGFSRYLYFLFAPTLVYRDVYPRTESTDWSYVMSNFLQVLGCLVYVYYVMQRYLKPEFTIYSPHSVSFETLIKSTFRCIIPGGVMLTMGFFGFLHSWLNAWAEMLRFGDRMFYKDWWNASSYAEYYRTWNCVVHDWLYTYVYKDTQELFQFKRAKFVSSFLVFAVSATFHEYVIITMLKFFFPVLLLEFGGFGFPLIFIKMNGRRFSNVLMWASIIFGMGLMISMYSFEISARATCPPAFNEAILDWFIPRFWSCMHWQNGK